MVSIIDLIFIITLAGFVFYGFFFGLVRTIGSLAAFLAGLWVSVNYYLPLAGWLNTKGVFFGYFSAGKIIVFLLLFALVSRLIALLFSLLNKTFDLISIIPFLKTINRLLGAVLGSAVGALIITIAILFFSGLPLIGGWLAKIAASSKFLPYLTKFAKLFSFLIPVAADKIK